MVPPPVALVDGAMEARAMKIKLELDIPNDNYALVTKWLKHYRAENTIRDVLQRGADNSFKKYLGCARAHFKTGKNAYERFREGVLKEGDNG